MDTQQRAIQSPMKRRKDLTAQRRRGQRIISFLADKVIVKHIETMSVKLEREESYVIRLLIRKALGLKPTGAINQ